MARFGYLHKVTNSPNRRPVKKIISLRFLFLVFFQQLLCNGPHSVAEFLRFQHFDILRPFQEFVDQVVGNLQVVGEDGEIVAWLYCLRLVECKGFEIVGGVFVHLYLNDLALQFLVYHNPETVCEKILGVALPVCEFCVQDLNVVNPVEPEKPEFLSLVFPCQHIPALTEVLQDIGLQIVVFLRPVGTGSLINDIYLSVGFQGLDNRG